MPRRAAIANPGRLAAALAALLAPAAVLFAPAAARAGPPYITDDPQPTDPGHWEVYDYVLGVEAPGALAGEAGFDINYGAAKDVQLTAVLPLGYSARGYSLSGFDAGAGTIELAVKMKLLHQSDDSWLPDASFFPRVFAPTEAKFGPGRPNLWLPVWAEKDFGPWSVFGGGGYQLDPGPGAQDFWQGGIALTRSFGEKASLGAELWRQGNDTPGAGAFTAVNLGATWKLTRYWSLIGSAGPAWEDHHAHGSDFYLALKLDY
jgi:hypothetical protein